MTKIENKALVEKWMHAMNAAHLYHSKKIKRTFSAGRKSQISDRQFEIMTVIEYLNINTISELAKVMDLNKSTLSIIVSKLVDRGFILRELPSTVDDGRKIYFVLSEEGKKFLTNVGQEDMNFIVMVYNNMSKEQKREIKKVINNIKKVNDSSERFEGSSLVTEVLNNRVDQSVNFEPKVREAFKVFGYFAFCVMNAGFNAVKSGAIKKNEVLTANQANLLFCIANLKLNTISALEEHLNASGSTISITVSKMVEKGILAKSPAPRGQDGRVVYIHLTEEGEKIYNESLNDVRNLFGVYLSTITNRDKRMLDEAFDSLLLAFNEN